MRLAAAAFIAVLAGIAACSGPTLKAKGAECVSSSECSAGLLCDLAQTMPVCTGSGVTPPEYDAAVVDGHPLIDGGGGIHVDGSVQHDAAHVIDAPHVDAPPAVDAAGSDAGSGSGV